VKRGKNAIALRSCGTHDLQAAGYAPIGPKVRDQNVLYGTNIWQNNPADPMLETLRQMLENGAISRVEEYTWKDRAYIRVFVKGQKGAAWDGPKTPATLKLIHTAHDAERRKEKKGTRRLHHEGMWPSVPSAAVGGRPQPTSLILAIALFDASRESLREERLRIFDHFYAQVIFVTLHIG
jgi:hypothetical protein